jgi:heptosyltransferase-2
VLDGSKKILIRATNWIGDAVMTIPVVQAIRRAYPEAHISLLAKPWVSEIFHENPDIDETILHEESHASIIGKFRLASKLRKKKFDTAILLQNAFDAALITRLAGIPERIGYNLDSRGFLLTHAIPVNEEVQAKHQVYYYLDLLKSIGLQAGNPRPYIYLGDDEKQWARDFLRSHFTGKNSALIGINPGATYGSAKRWPAERFATVISGIVKELNGRVIIFGSEKETDIAEEIVNNVVTQGHQFSSQVLNLSGKTSLRELAALIAECDVFVTNDSGPMHMAAALCIPVVAIFGSTDWKATGPFGEGHKVITKNVPCSPCMKRECPEEHLKCMTEIGADEVFGAVKEIFPAHKAVFLDKDGTLIEDKNYLNSFDDLVILKGVKAALQRLGSAGFKLIGITNQSGIARGIVDEKFVLESNSFLQDKLDMDDFFYCPHHPDEKCPCRKPGSLMILNARLKHRIDLRHSYVIGDKESDVLLARKSGSTGILLSSTPLFENTSASYIAKNLSDAVQWILEREK